MDTPTQADFNQHHATPVSYGDLLVPTPEQPETGDKGIAFAIGAENGDLAVGSDKTVEEAIELFTNYYLDRELPVPDDIADTVEAMAFGYSESPETDQLEYCLLYNSNDRLQLFTGLVYKRSADNA